MSFIIEMFSYPFIVRAFIVGVLVSLCAALLGVSLVLKQYSMIGDGLSHVSYGALSIALACNVAPLKVSIPVVIAAAFLLLRMTEKGLMKSDAAIAAVSASALAIGVSVTSLTTGMTTDVNSYMFGSILAMTKDDVILCVLLSCVVLALFIVSYHNIFAVTFDEDFAKAVGTKADLYNLLLAVIVAVVIVLAMNLVGSLLISALVIFPALSAMRLFQNFRSVTVCSAVLSVSCAALGILVSILAGTPVGSTIVAVDILAFLICSALGRARGGGAG